jgi:hypothetical protein
LTNAEYLVHDDHKLPLITYCVLPKVLREVLYCLFPLTRLLVTLDVSVDPPHKQIRAQVTNSSYTFKTTKSVFKKKRKKKYKILNNFVSFRSVVLSLVSAAKSTSMRGGK